MKCKDNLLCTGGTQTSSSSRLGVNSKRVLILLKLLLLPIYVQSAEAYKRTVVHVECKQNIQCGGALKKSSWANSTAELTALAF